MKKYYDLILARSPALLSLMISLVLSSQAHSDTVPIGIWKLGDGRYFASHAIVVDKTKRTLTVWENQPGGLTKVAEYPSDLGRKSGPKIAKGDHRTPEGVYFLEKKLEGPGLSFQEYGVRAFTTNYPNLFDRRIGKTGDGIWLHSVPDTVSLERGSRGCVVVRNNAILDISKYVQLGTTPILIADNVDYVDRKAAESTVKEITTLFERWKNSWQTKDLNTYMSFYSLDFESLGMKRDQWHKYKENLNNKYQQISVKFSEPVIYEHQGQVVVRALQSYKSEQHEDFGEKILFLKKEDSGKYEIIAEDWAPVNSSEALQAMIQPTRSAAQTN